MEAAVRDARRGGFCVVLSLLAVLGGSGCGYALAGRGSFLPATIMTIGIPAFTNHTTVPLLWNADARYYWHY